MSAAQQLLGRVVTRAGTVNIWRVVPTYAGAGTEIVGYVAEVATPASTYRGPRIAMAVTVHDPTVDPVKASATAEHAALAPPGKWDGVTLLVDDVYADPALRGRGDDDVSPAVAIGRFLHSRGCFEAHSSVRSVAGDTWAALVGGHVPALRSRPTGDLEGHMRRWLVEVTIDPERSSSNTG